ncbi:Hypothetical predicted protein [Cloeon dipterum]|uniref:Uncharacterized protein n=1 Tax=Cloeon dipterum TaxID=197152 RepID=A0A8S1DA96_9INSE|nr:Hypothetical predicted protein [Cloeon dipterum]
MAQNKSFLWKRMTLQRQISYSELGSSASINSLHLKPSKEPEPQPTVSDQLDALRYQEYPTSPELPNALPAPFAADPCFKKDEENCIVNRYSTLEF